MSGPLPGVSERGRHIVVADEDPAAVAGIRLMVALHPGDTPYAAVNETCELVERRGGSRGSVVSSEAFPFPFHRGLMRSNLLFPVVLLSLLAPSVGVAQTYVTTTEHRVPFERVDSLRKLIKETQPVLAEVKRRGGILDDVWLIHAWAGEYSVVEIVTYKSWAAIEDTTLGFAAAQRKVIPDSVARKKVNDRFNWVFQGVPHTDNIYIKVE